MPGTSHAKVSMQAPWLMSLKEPTAQSVDPEDPAMLPRLRPPPPSSRQEQEGPENYPIMPLWS
jgi:hypothetical protein